jgi:hypothetical protein
LEDVLVKKKKLQQSLGKELKHLKTNYIQFCNGVRANEKTQDSIML